MTAAAPPLLPWTPTPKQEELIRLIGFHPYKLPDPLGPAEEVLFGGAAGGAKTGALMILSTMIAQEWPGSTTGAIRLTYTNLYDTWIAPMINLLPEREVVYNHEFHEFRWANGSRTRFRALEDEPTTYRKQRGPEYDALLYDEATELTVGMITFMNSRCRSTRPGWRPLKVYASNPVGPSTQYFADTFVDAAPPGTTFLAEPATVHGRRVPRAFLASRLDDNPYWADVEAVRAEYEAIADEELRQAMLEGNWHISSGTFFRSFRYPIHVRHLDPREYQDWPRVRGYDYGQDLGVCLWGARNREDGAPRTHIYRELLLRNLPAQYQARMITTYSRHDPPIRLTLAGQDVNRRTGTGNKAGQLLRDELLAGHLPVTVANVDRRTGWDRVHRSLFWNEGWARPPELSIEPDCVQLIKELQNAQRDPIKQWDLRQPKNRTDARDDALDALRMLLMGARSVIETESPQRYWDTVQQDLSPEQSRRAAVANRLREARKARVR